MAKKINTPFIEGLTFKFEEEDSDVFTIVGGELTDGELALPFEIVQDNILVTWPSGSISSLSITDIVIVE